MKKLLFCICIGLGGLSLSAQEFHMPAPSPHVVIDQSFSTSFIKLDYSRPAVKGREIFGDLIPYGEVWRTGANQATKISFGEAVQFNGQMVEKGTYVLYTIPGEQNWKVILNKGLDNWGAAGYKSSDNVAESEIRAQKNQETQESFSLSIEDIDLNSAHLVLRWADVKLEIPIQADNHDAIMAHLEKALNGGQPPYATAANYYLNEDVKMDEALVYIQKAIEANPRAYYLYWSQALIYEKLDKKKEAIAAAQKAAELAKEDSPAFAYEYQHKYEEIQNRLK